MREVYYHYPYHQSDIDSPSLIIGVTSVAECSMSFFSTLLALIYYTTISGVGNLCIVQCCLLLDLLFDQSEGVHDLTPEKMGEFNLPFLQSFASYASGRKHAGSVCSIQWMRISAFSKGVKRVVSSNPCFNHS